MPLVKLKSPPTQIRDAVDDRGVPRRVLDPLDLRDFFFLHPDAACCFLLALRVNGHPISDLRHRCLADLGLLHEHKSTLGNSFMTSFGFWQFTFQLQIVISPMQPRPKTSGPRSRRPLLGPCPRQSRGSGHTAPASTFTSNHPGA